MDFAILPENAPRDGGRVLLSTWVVAIAAWVCTLASSPSCWGQGFNPEQQISAGQGLVTSAPAFDLDPNGNPFVVWVQEGQVFVAAGIDTGSVTVQLTVSSLPSADVDLHISSSTASATILFDRESGLGSGQSDIFAITSNGGVFGSPMNITNSLLSELRPSISGAAGDREVVWEEQGAGAPTIQLSSNFAPAILIGVGSRPRVGSGGGNRCVAYERDGDLWARIDTGTGFGPELAVASSATSVRVAVDNAGTCHLVYESAGSVGYASSSGAAFSSAVTIAGATQPDISTNGNEVAVAYIATGDVWVRTIANGVLDNALLATDTAGDESMPAVEVDPLGFVRIAYLRDGDVYSRNNVTPPTASFSNMPAQGEAPLTVNFVHTGNGVATSWSWDFGDGSTSGIRNPSHTYETLGFHTVSLTVEGPGGTSTLTQPNVVRVDPPSNVMRVPSFSVLEGQNNVYIPVLGTHVAPMQGYQVAFSWDCDVLVVTDVTLDFTVTNALSPEFYAPTLEGPPSCTFAMGLVYDTVPPFDGRTLGPGNNQRLLNIVCNIPFGIAPLQTVVDLRNNIGDPPIFNVFTVNGSSVVPVLQDGVVDIIPFVFPPPRLFIRGDADLSGIVGLSDAIVILNYLFLGGADPLCFDAADVDDSGGMTLSDVIFLLNYLFLGTAVPPYPNPSSGFDPTPDSFPDC